MVVKQMNEQVQQVNDLFLSGQVKESYQLAKEILGNDTAIAEEAYQVIQQRCGNARGKWVCKYASAY